MSRRATIAWILFVAISPLVALASVALNRELQEGEARIAAERTALARATSLATEAFIDGHLSTIRTLAVALSSSGILDDDAELLDYLAAARAVNPDWEGLALVGSDGSTRASAQPSSTPSAALNIADRSYFQQVMATRRPVVSPGVIGRASGSPAFVVAVPIELASGENGVLLAPMRTERLRAALRSQIGTDSLLVVVVDQGGQTIAHRDPEAMQTLAPVRGRADVDAALSGAVGHQVLELGSSSTLIAYAPVAEFGWAVLIVEPTDAAFAPVRADVLREALLFAVVLAVLAGAGWYLSGRLSLSYDRLVDARDQAERAFRDAERGRRQAALLADVSRELSLSPDHQTALASLARLAVPEIADWCAVDEVAEDGLARRLAMAHADPSRVELATAREWREADSTALTAMREGKAQLIGEMPDRLQASVAQDIEHLLTLRSADVKSAIVVPLIARGHTLGAMTLVSAESGRVYGEAEVAFAQELASRAALVVENARLREDLQHAVNIRDEFLASVSHDLRNPLAAIKATAQVLKLQIERRGSVEPDRLANMLGSIDETTTRMGRIIEELLDVTRLQLGRPLELDRQPTDIVALAQTVADEYRRSATRHTILVQAETEVVGVWDSVRLHRAVGNLVDNAVKYSPEGGTIRLTVDRAGDHGGEAVITIRDEGLGIPDRDLPRIFDRFRRGSNVSDGIAGTGIGLASVRQIVEEHGGRVAVESWIGQGTEVKVWLPLADEADHVPQAPERDGEGQVV